MKIISVLLLVSSVLFPHLIFAKTVRYELVVTNAKVNLSGKKEVDFALQVNGGIPAPTLEFTEGDDAEILVRNEIAEQELSIHWHGLLLPVEMDGVSYVTTKPILKKGTHLFRFPIRQSGTYWYHSHTGLQEQKGVFGAIVIHPKKEEIKVDKEVVVILSDWIDEDPDDVLKNLKKDGDYYRYKKGTVRSIWGAYQNNGLGTYFGNEWVRMGGMDLSDVGYDAFLVNGKPDSQIFSVAGGSKPAKVRVRLINAAASTYFNVGFGQAPMEVIAADGMMVRPLEAKNILVGMAETYDFVVTLDGSKNYQLLSTAQDGTGRAIGWLGNPAGEKIEASAQPPIDLYAPMMDHSGHESPAADHSGGHGGHHGHHASVLENLTVDQLAASESTSFPKDYKISELKLVLGGDMERYVWHINGKAMNQERSLFVKQGDVVRITFENQTMMHHPMHLHGHFFRVLNSAGDSSPMKHTVDVGPHSSRTIEFMATEPGEWLLHCHNLYHMKTGMARVVQYIDFKPSAEIAEVQKQDPHLHDHWYMSGRFEGRTNFVREFVKYSNTWNEWNLIFQYEKPESMSAKWSSFHEIVYRRWFGTNLNLFATAHGTKTESFGIFGARYMLPLLVEAQVGWGTNSKWQVQLEKKFQWTSKLLSKVEFKAIQGESIEPEISLDYAPDWHWNVGLKFLEHTTGAGLIYHF